MPTEPTENDAPAAPVLPAVRFRLSLAEFAALADVPPEHEWLANLTKPKTKRAYKADVAEFIAFTGLEQSADLRSVARAHVILWRKNMEDRKLAKASIRRKLSALSSLSATITLTPVGVSVTPVTASLGASQTQQFTAAVTGISNTNVTWTLSPNTGSISSAGMYTAPASITSQQTVTVTATSVADSTANASATITLTPVSVSVTPVTASLGASQAQQFTATVTGSSNTSVAWTLSPNTGSISSAGLYTAPAAITSQQNVTVTATSVADNTKSATSTIQLTSNPVAVTPVSAVVMAGQAVQFSGAVTASPLAAVVWSLAPGTVGSISSTGLYTAPIVVQGPQYGYVVGTSASDPNASNAVPIAVQPVLSGFTATPSSLPHAATTPTVLFTASVYGAHALSSLILQSINEDGSLSSSLGSLHDDGMNGDAVAGDGVYSLQLDIPTDAAGMLSFAITGAFSDLQNQAMLGPVNVPIVPMTESNSDSSLWATNILGQNQVFWNTASSNVVQELLYSSQSVSGPWSIVNSWTYPVGEVPPITVEQDDPGGASLNDTYYMLVALDSTGATIKQYAPVFLPAYVDPGSPPLLTLQTSPSGDLTLDASKKGRSLAKPHAGQAVPHPDDSGSGQCSISDPWNHPFVTDEEFTCTYCVSLQQIRDLFSGYQSWLSGTIVDVDGSVIDPAS